MTSDSSSVEVSVHVQLFSGKVEDWNTWSFGFKACVAIPPHSDYKDLISSKEESKMDENEKKVLKMYHLNSLAFSHLVSSI
jgi:hypothetical protein